MGGRGSSSSRGGASGEPLPSNPSINAAVDATDKHATDANNYGMEADNAAFEAKNAKTGDEAVAAARRATDAMDKASESADAAVAAYAKSGRNPTAAKNLREAQWGAKYASDNATEAWNAVRSRFPNHPALTELE